MRALLKNTSKETLVPHRILNKNEVAKKVVNMTDDELFVVYVLV